MTPKAEKRTLDGAAVVGAIVGLAIVSLWNGLLIWAGLELVNVAFPRIGPLGYWQATAFGFGLGLLTAPVMAALRTSR